jgi:hypothetical protein
MAACRICSCRSAPFSRDFVLALAVNGRDFLLLLTKRLLSCSIREKAPIVKSKSGFQPTPGQAAESRPTLNGNGLLQNPKMKESIDFRTQ